MEIEQQVAAISEDMKLDTLRETISKFKDSDANDDQIAVLTIQETSELLNLRKKLHKILCTAFSSRFADLSTLLPDYEIYARTAKYLATHNKIDDQDLLDLYTKQQNIALSIGITQLGPEIHSPAFEAACDLQIEASTVSQELTSIAASAVSRFAPNLCALVGADLAAYLVSFAGGIKELSILPACNIKLLGAKKTGMLGMSSRSTNNYQGILYKSDIVQETPSDFRDAAFRDLANKATLAIRVDVSNSRTDGSFGAKQREDLKSRIDKKMNNRTPKTIKPIEPPGMEKIQFRGGRRARANKKKFGLGEVLKERQKLQFGIDGQFDDDGTQLGVTAIHGFRKKTLSTDAPFQEKISKKLAAYDKKGK